VVLTRFGSSSRQCVDAVPSSMMDTIDSSNSNDTRYSLTMFNCHCDFLYDGVIFPRQIHVWRSTSPPYIYQSADLSVHPRRPDLYGTRL
jgi:hypothetical protein